MNMHRLTLFLTGLLLYPSLAFAKPQPTGIGAVANNMMQPVTLLSNFIMTGCILIGAAFMFASLIKYVEHRRSPLMVPISTVIFLLLGGLALLSLPLLSLFVNSGIPYTFLKVK